MAAPLWVSTSTAKGAGATATGNKPASVAAGDLLIALLHSKADNVLSVSAVPSGWTLIRSGTITGGQVIHSVYYKLAGGSEPSTYAWTLTGVTATYHWLVDISRITGANTVSPINASGVQSNSSSTSVTAPSISPTVADCLLVVTGGDDNGRSYTPPSGMTERWEDRYNVTYDISASGATQTLTSSGATGTRVFSLNAPNASVATSIAIAPPGASGPAIPVFMNQYRQRWK